jgi:hypothetical protein
MVRDEFTEKSSEIPGSLYRYFFFFRRSPRDKAKLTSMEAIPPNGGGKTVIQLFFYVGAYTMKVALSNPVS